MEAKQVIHTHYRQNDNCGIVKKKHEASDL
jgi:hypothetical protein